MAERAQASAVQAFFGRLDAATKATDAIEALSKYLNDGKEPAKASNPARPRVELTISQLLSLPGEWDRAQYLALFLVLHSEDVKFVDTNEFENLMRDIELGKLTQTATSGLSTTGSLGFGNAPPAGTTVSRPGNVSFTADTRYTEALERQLKEQLQFRASSLDLDGRVLAVVLKSSQQNKLPTLVRQIVTLQYQGSLASSAKGRILRVDYQQGKPTGFSFQDEVRRVDKDMAATDRNSADVDIWRTQATPVMIGVVRRVRNATGVNTSIEDDDDVEYVTQARVLQPITLDAPSKCQFVIHVQKPATSVYLAGPGDPFGKQAVFVDRESAERFVLAIRERMGASINVSDGLLFNEAGMPVALAGYRIVFGPDPSTTTKNWTGITGSDVAVSQPQCK